VKAVGGAPRVAHLAVVPVLRSSVLERNGDSVELRYRRIGEDIEPSLLSPRVRQAGMARLALELVRRPPAVLELPEPMWFREWPRTLLLGLVARARTRSRVVTYAIENLPVSESLTPARLGLPGIVVRIVRRAWELSTFVVHDVAFGTRASQANYARATSAARGWSGPLLPEQISTCDCWDPGVAARPTVLFLAELTERKGIDDLLRAWELAPTDGWTLQLCGFGEGSGRVQAWAQDVENAHVELRPSRARIHELLRQASVVVLPSVGVPGWREQVGLSLLEGAAHGCRLICSSDSGASQEVARGSGCVVPPRDAAALAAALEEAIAAGPCKGDIARRVDSRRAFEAWARR
jgi:glycosyltransferase involved in cell wall biosynthesis